MIKLLKNARVYAPAPLGVKDILIAGEKICRIDDRIEGYEGLPDVEVFDLEGHPEVLQEKPAELEGRTLGEALLAPTKIYVKPVLALLEQVQVRGISHITGGGFYENIPRSLKKGCCARIARSDVRTPALFGLLQKAGNIPERDMFNTFNMGVGMVLTVPAAQADKALEILHANGEPGAYRLGVIAEGEGVELC